MYSCTHTHTHPHTHKYHRKTFPKVGLLLHCIQLTFQILKCRSLEASYSGNIDVSRIHRSCSVLQSVYIYIEYVVSRLLDSEFDVSRLLNDLPSTATHCNTLQHTATHCNMFCIENQESGNICRISIFTVYM